MDGDEYVQKVLADLFGDSDDDGAAGAEAVELDREAERLRPNTGFLTRLVHSTDRTNKRIAEEEATAAAAVQAKAKRAGVQTKRYLAKRSRGLQLLNHVADKYGLKVRVFPRLKPTDALPSDTCEACGGSVAPEPASSEALSIILPSPAVPTVTDLAAGLHSPVGGSARATAPKRTRKPSTGTTPKSAGPSLALFKAGLGKALGRPHSTKGANASTKPALVLAKKPGGGGGGGGTGGGTGAGAGAGAGKPASATVTKRGIKLGPKPDAKRVPIATASHAKKLQGATGVQQPTAASAVKGGTAPPAATAAVLQPSASTVAGGVGTDVSGVAQLTAATDAPVRGRAPVVVGKRGAGRRPVGPPLVVGKRARQRVEPTA